MIADRTPGLLFGRFLSGTVLFMSKLRSVFPTYVKFWKIVRWPLAAIALIYGLLWFRYTTVERVLTFDPVVALNARFADVPSEHRGWPQMRKALLAMHADDPIAPELLREASRCEVLGLSVGHPGDLSPEDKILWPELVTDQDQSKHANPWSWEQSAFLIPLPHLGDLRKASLRLKDHALVQGHTGGLEDLRAMRRISVLCQEHPTIINQLVGMSILSLEVDTISQLLLEHGMNYSDEVLAELEVELGLASDALKPLNLEGEYITFDDVLQRVYSDDGAGNGIFIGEAGTWLADNGADFTGFPIVVEHRLTSLAAPFLAQWMPDRKTTRELYANTLAAQVKYCEAPLWDRTEREAFDGTGNLIIDLLLPDLTKAFDQIQLKHMEIKSMSLVVAAYRVRVRSGEFPEEPPIEVQDFWIDDLVSYEVKNGLPHVQSVGSERKGQVLFPVRSE